MREPRLSSVREEVGDPVEIGSMFGDLTAGVDIAEGSRRVGDRGAIRMMCGHR